MVGECLDRIDGKVYNRSMMTKMLRTQRSRWTPRRVLKRAQFRYMYSARVTRAQRIRVIGGMEALNGLARRRERLKRGTVSQEDNRRIQLFLDSW